MFSAIAATGLEDLELELVDAILDIVYKLVEVLKGELFLCWYLKDCQQN